MTAPKPQAPTDVRTRVSGGVRALLRLFPVTPLGASILAMASSAYFLFGVPRADYVIQLVSLLACALVAIAVVMVLPATWLTWRAAAQSDDPERAGVTTEARRGPVSLLRMPALGIFPFLDVTWRWIDPAPTRVDVVRERTVMQERALPMQRSLVASITRRFVVEDAFGLARVSFHRTQLQPLHVLPWIGKLSPEVVLQALSMGEEVSHPMGSPRGDRVDMRRYVAGDPLRLILWKVYARTGELVVRNPEHALSPSLRVAAYLVAHRADEASAAMARVCVESDVLGTNWLFGTDGNGATARTSDEALPLISDSHSVRSPDEAEAAGLASFIDVARHRGQRQLVLFVPPVAGVWQDRVVRAIRSWSGTVLVVVTADSVQQSEPERALEKVLRFPRRADVDVAARVTVESLEAVAAPLRAAGSAVIAIERAGGRTVLQRLSSTRRAA